MNDAARAAMAQIVHRLMTSDDGRLLMEDLRLSFGDRRSFVEGDGLATAFREGQRDVYLSLLALIAEGKDPEKAKLKIVTQDDAPEAAA